MVSGRMLFLLTLKISFIPPIGKIEGIITDNQWHTAKFNLYEMLKKDNPYAEDYIVEEIIMGDWNDEGWAQLGLGSNPPGLAYYLDNHRVI